MVEDERKDMKKKDEWKEDKPIKKPLNLITIKNRDRRKTLCGVDTEKVVEFGWDNEDVYI